MVTIRYVNKNDIEYIKHILTIHDVFFKDYISIILDKLILNKNIVSCLIAESNGKQIGFDINVLDMLDYIVPYLPLGQAIRKMGKLYKL